MNSNRAAVHVACELVVLDFMAYYDSGDAAGAAALFAPDGRWQRADGLVVGREALGRLFATRKSGTVVRHVITNLRTQVLADDRAEVRAYVMLFKQDAVGDPPVFPVALDGVSGFGRYIDVLRRTDQGWLIASKSSVMEFKPA